MHDPAQAFREAMLATLGHAPDVIEPGRLHRFATSDKRGDDAGWCKLFDDLRGGVFGCNRSGARETWLPSVDGTLPRHRRIELARQVAQAAIERERMQRAEWSNNSQRIAKLWAECVPLTPGDPVTLYLKRRGFGRVWPLPACLRLHPALPYWHGGNSVGTFPAMVAPMVAPNGRIVALHRTYLSSDGRKADVAAVKKLSATAGVLAGACVLLHPPRGGTLGIAEGIETALAAWLASGVPTVAAYCAGNLAAWQWPASVQRIVIFADHDKAGREAAGLLRSRALAARLRCGVLTPTDDGADWCDVWAARDAVLADVEGAA
jgi:putative DNA primase/helicase